MADAFPSTPIIDSAQRADEDPLSDGGKWVTPTGAAGTFKILSNRIAANAIGAEMYRGERTYLNAEVFTKINTYSGQHILWVRLQDGGNVSPIRIANQRGYRFGFLSSGYFVQHVLNNSPQTLLGTIAWPAGYWGDGIWVGGRITGGTLEVWARKSDTDPWVFFNSTSDTQTTLPGVLGLDLSATDSRLSNYGGGETGNPQVGQRQHIIYGRGAA